MDCQVVYEGKEGACEELCRLRAHAEHILHSEQRFVKAQDLLGRAKAAFAEVCLTESIGKARAFACYMIDDLTSAMMVYSGRYFKYGTVRLFEELEALQGAEQLVGKIKQIAQARGLEALRALCKQMLLLVQAHVRPCKAPSAPSAELAGTYEEMYSNWRNKVALAAEKGDVFGSFANLCGLHGMLAELAQAYMIPEMDVMGAYDPDRLAANVQIFDDCLQAYEKVYQKAGICVRRYADADAFVKDYLGE